MKQQRQINPIQASILRQLFQHESLHFAEINVNDVPSDQFSYHLRRLIRVGSIEKTSEGAYRLSTSGKLSAILLYPNENGFIEQGFTAVRIVLTKVQDGKTYYLLQRRKLVPFRGTYATPGDKVIFGEDIVDTARRSLEAQTGLICDFQVRGVHHIKDRYLGDIVQDKFFYVVSATNPRGEFMPQVRKGTNVWMTYDELEQSGQSIHGGLEMLRTAASEQFVFKEVTYDIDSY